MDNLFSNILTVVGVAFVLMIVGAVAGSIFTGRAIRDAIAAQPAPVIHNTATANAGGQGGGGSGVGLPQIIGIIGGVALIAWAMTGFRTGAVDSTPNAIPVAQPVATSAPVATAVPVRQIEPIARPVSTPMTVWPMVVAVLLAAAVGLWGYVGLILINRKRQVTAPRDQVRSADTSPGDLKAAMSQTETPTREPDEGVWQSALDYVPEDF